jgi:hypothetical protein
MSSYERKIGTMAGRRRPSTDKKKYSANLFVWNTPTSRIEIGCSRLCLIDYFLRQHGMRVAHLLIDQIF